MVAPFEGLAARCPLLPASVALSALGVLLGCTAEPAPNRAKEILPVIVGEDDRVELFALPSEAADVARESVGALVFAHHVARRSNGVVEVRAPSAAEAFDLCSDEPFADQPAAAYCSVVLIDDVLVATAAHCLGEASLAYCEQSRIVFDYNYVDRGQLDIDESDVFACVGVVFQDPIHDMAILQLDRPARRRPVVLDAKVAAAGDQVVVASHGAGLPLKCEASAVITAADAEGFSGEFDTFGGSSGGVILSQALQLVGIIVAGSHDWVAVDGCSRARHTESGAERAEHAVGLRNAFCAEGYGSAHFCGTLPVCGDGICGMAEACERDCYPPTCGDRICTSSEVSTCEVDCERYVNVPASWLLEPEKYLQWHPEEPRPDGTASCAHSPRGSQPHLLVPLFLAILATVKRLEVRGVGRRSKGPLQ